MSRNDREEKALGGLWTNLNSSDQRRQNELFALPSLPAGQGENSPYMVYCRSRKIHYGVPRGASDASAVPP